MTDIRVNAQLNLTQLHETDLEQLMTQINDPVIYENTLTVPHPYTMEHARSFLEHAREFEKKEGFQKDWVIRHNGTLIGGIGALYNYGVRTHKTEIGYWLGKDWRGKGIMSDVIGAFVSHLFASTLLVRLEAHVFVGNVRSARALERNGFVNEGIAKAAFVKHGVPKDTWQYALVKHDYHHHSAN